PTCCARIDRSNDGMDFEMPQLSLGCPHCLTTKIGFTPRQAVPVEAGRTLLFLQCQGCGRDVIAEVLKPLDHVRTWMSDIGGAPGSPGRILQTYASPTLMEPKAPDDVPDNIRSAFVSGLTNLKLPGGATIAAIAFRRSIELAAKKLKPDGEGNLKQRI